MQNSISRSLASAAALFMVPGMALADVTANEVWDNWKTYAETFGQTVTVGSEKTRGDTLTLNDVTFSSEFSEGAVAGTLEFLEMRERGDGTVAITMSPDFPFTMSAEPDSGEALDMAIMLRQTGTSIVASGSDGDITYDYVSSEIGMAIEKFIVDGEELDGEFELSLRDVDGQYASSEGELNTLTSQMTAAAMDFAMKFADPESGGQVDMSGTVQDVSSSSTASFPPDFSMEDPTTFYSKEMMVEGGFKAGASNYSMSFADRNDSFSADGTSSASALNIALKDGSIQYGGSAKDTNYRLKSPQLPIPEITLGLAETGFNLLMPMTPSDEPSEFGFLIEMIGLEVSDMIWGMVDPTGALPHDPATVIFDIGGQMNWLVDISDPEFAEKFEGEMPAELYELSLNDLTISVVGAEAKGTGQFVFDNSDLETFGGMPAPTGAIDLDLSGINGLMDTLVKMGLLPQEQAMGARMMMGLFARPGQGEDTWTSKIEVKGDGSVFANGQQLK
ncbi:MAG: DUF2125 domain-containing protein [Marinosulfonomonas sp.]|nr:DUF2125 domain-containing protein [Marinosulfonomonas sp.]